jgi:hypothetical protein
MDSRGPYAGSMRLDQTDSRLSNSRLRSTPQR